VISLAFAAELNFIDRGSDAGLKETNTFGGKTQKTFILESTGNGVAIFDYDGDGHNDIFIANGTTLQGEGGPSFLYHNDGKGNFTLVSDAAGITKKGWAQGVCAGDYDNDGRTDLLVTYYGTNVLYRNLGNGRFADVTKQAGLPVTGVRWGAGCSFTDYDRDGKLDLFISNYVDLDMNATPKPGQDPTCQFKGLPTACGPRGLPAAANVLYHNNGDGTFTDVSVPAGILKPGRRYGLGVVAADFDNDGWPDIYVACDMTPSLLYHNLGNGKFEERAVESGVAYNFDGRLQAGMGVAVADYDGNGFLDIAKTNFSGDLTSLFKNEDGSSSAMFPRMRAWRRTSYSAGGLSSWMWITTGGKIWLWQTGTCIRKWSKARLEKSICRKLCCTGTWVTASLQTSVRTVDRPFKRCGLRAEWRPGIWMATGIRRS